MRLTREFEGIDGHSLEVTVDFNPQEGVVDVVEVVYRKGKNSIKLQVGLLETLGMLESFWESDTWVDEYQAKKEGYDLDDEV